MADTSTLIELLGAYDNFEEPEPLWNRSSTMIGLTVPFVTVTWILVILRLYTRLKIVHSPGWDDIFVLLFLLSGTANGISICIASRSGLGQHLLFLDFAEMQKFLQSIYVATATYNMSTALIKISLLFQYLRIFEGGRMRTICIALLILVGLWGTAYTLLAWFPCTPIYAYWNWAESQSGWGYGSLNANQFFGTYTSHAVLNMIFDFLVLSIPMPLYFRHDTGPSTKLRLAALLSMGTFVSCISIWRLVSIAQHKAATWPTFDPSWYGPISIVLGMIEVNLASFCACVPVFWPVLTARLDNIFVTQEVEITRENRYSDKYDQVALSRSNTHSRANSEASESRLNIPGKTKNSHYLDEYIMDQVDPLRPKTTLAASSEVIAGAIESSSQRKQGG